jgi:quercetin dioxygenase-like cupin family protein
MPVLTAPDGPTHELPGTRFTAQASPNRGSSDTSVWRVEIDPGTLPTPHAVTREEIFVVLAGRAWFQTGADPQVAGPGDTVVVPAGVPFVLGCDGDEPLVALCLLPVGGQAQVPGAEPFTPPWAL